MSKNLINKIKGLMTQYGFVSAELEDGTEIKVDGEIEEGNEVTVVIEEGEIPAPDGEHTLEDGTVIETEEGVIVDVEESEEFEDEEVEVTVDKESGEVIIDIQELINVLDDTFKKLKEKMEKIDSLERVIDEVKEDFNKFKKEPGASKIKSKTDFSSHKSDSVDAVVKRIAELRKNK